MNLTTDIDIPSILHHVDTLSSWFSRLNELGKNLLLLEALKEVDEEGDGDGGGKTGICESLQVGFTRSEEVEAEYATMEAKAKLKTR